MEISVDNRREIIARLSRADIFMLSRACKFTYSLFGAPKWSLGVTDSAVSQQIFYLASSGMIAPHQAVVIAAMHGRVDALRGLISAGAGVRADAIFRCRDSTAVKYMLEAVPKLFDQVLISAIVNKYDKIIDMMMDDYAARSLPISSTVIITAIKHGNARVVTNHRVLTRLVDEYNHVREHEAFVLTMAKSLVYPREIIAAMENRASTVYNLCIQHGCYDVMTYLIQACGWPIPYRRCVEFVANPAILKLHIDSLSAEELRVAKKHARSFMVLVDAGRVSMHDAEKMTFHGLNDLTEMLDRGMRAPTASIKFKNDVIACMELLHSRTGWMPSQEDFLSALRLGELSVALWMYGHIDGLHRDIFANITNVVRDVLVSSCYIRAIYHDDLLTAVKEVYMTDITRNKSVLVSTLHCYIDARQHDIDEYRKLAEWLREIGAVIPCHRIVSYQHAQLDIALIDAGLINLADDRKSKITCLGIVSAAYP